MKFYPGSYTGSKVDHGSRLEWLVNGVRFFDHCTLSLIFTPIIIRSPLPAPAPYAFRTFVAFLSFFWCMPFRSAARLSTQRSGSPWRVPSHSQIEPSHSPCTATARFVTPLLVGVGLRQAAGGCCTGRAASALAGLAGRGRS